MKKQITLISIALAFILICTLAKASFYADNDFDGEDLDAFIAAYGSTAGSIYYNPDCDFNYDGQVDESDLSTFSSNFGKTDLVQPDFPIYFPDSNLEAVIRESINKPEPNDIMYSDLQDLTSLNAQSRGIIELEGLQYCSSLYSLRLDRNQISDISSLAGLVNLSTLLLYSNQIGDINPLSGLVNLDTLLILSNQISDISPLAGLTNLSVLNIRNNQISDTNPLADLAYLSFLDLSENSISTSGLDPLAGLVNLSSLLLSYNQITDISPLVNNFGIGTGDYVAVIVNPLNSTACAVHIPDLVGRGVTIDHDCP